MKGIKKNLVNAKQLKCVFSFSAVKRFVLQEQYYFQSLLHLYSISAAFLFETQSSSCITVLWEFHQNWMQLYICILAVWEGGSHIYNKYKALWCSLLSLRRGQTAWMVLIAFSRQAYVKLNCSPCFEAKSTMREHRFPVKKEKMK